MAFDIDDGRIVGLDVLADPDRLREVDVDRLLVDWRQIHCAATVVRGEVSA
ncbi:MAG TPA: hypothetical protein VKY71_10440 [Actinotalea caeni]|uniref:hypothetical protein n=1 Tax=Actinotalea caeni TaxID=1348467 RepID=UPI002B4AE443|nr:hypothetical protein [Actinotalea caeni]HLV55976.1 hypothetical protein [Actinotalea caeni]